jgi:hypothetical protein
MLVTLTGVRVFHIDHIVKALTRHLKPASRHSTNHIASHQKPRDIFLKCAKQRTFQLVTELNWNPLKKGCDLLEALAGQLTPRHLQLISCNESQPKKGYTVVEVCKDAEFPTLKGVELVSLDNEYAKKGTIYT